MLCFYFLILLQQSYNLHLNLQHQKKQLHGMTAILFFIAVKNRINRCKLNCYKTCIKICKERTSLNLNIKSPILFGKNTKSHHAEHHRCKNNLFHKNLHYNLLFIFYSSFFRCRKQNNQCNQLSHYILRFVSFLRYKILQLP